MQALRVLAVTVSLPLSLSFAACGSIPAPICAGEECTAEPEPDAEDTGCAMEAEAPAKLLDTCFGRIANGEVAPNLRHYQPRFETHSKGATARRWVYLPPDSQVDVETADSWEFPVGSIFWQEFAVEGGDDRIETRMLEKTGAGTGPEAWRATSYFWTTRQSDADRGGDDGETPEPAEFYVVNGMPGYERSTPQECVTCHQGSADFVLGFGAVQLSDVSRPGNVEVWSEAGSLTAAQQPVELVGDAADHAVLGYLHVNCGSCHHPLGSQAAQGWDLSYAIATTTDLASTNVFRTAVYQNQRIVPGNPGSSTLYRRLLSGSDDVLDASFTNQLADWIRGIESSTAIIPDTLPLDVSADSAAGLELLGYSGTYDDPMEGVVFSISEPFQLRSRALVPVDTSKTYRVSGKFRSNGTVPSRTYFGLTPYDANGDYIRADQGNRVASSAARVDVAATTKTLIATVDPLVEWAQPPAPAFRRIIGFYFDGDTARLPDFVFRTSVAPYSEEASAGVYRQATGTTITLNEPLPDEVLSALTADTVVMNHYSGGSHLYAAAGNVSTAAEWTTFSGDVTGVGFSAGSFVFRPGTVYVKLLLLANYQQTGEDVQLLFDDLKLEVVPE